jgi:hypothetical protein
MKKDKAKEKDYSFKEDFRDQYQKKKSTQKQAKERRNFLRELREDSEWNK